MTTANDSDSGSVSPRSLLPSPSTTRVPAQSKDPVAWYQDFLERHDRLIARIEGKEVFSTAEVALLVKVAPRTVNKWFDSGRLGGERVGRSRRRQVSRAELVRFLREHGMPVPELLGEVGQATTNEREDADFDE